MSGLVKRLRIKAGMIEMGEMIAWGSDSALMREAADALELDAPAVQGEQLRYTNDGALAECPCCGSLDVGGAHDTVHCQSCGLTVMKPRPLQNAIDAWNTRTSRAHSAAPDVQGEPVATLNDHKCFDLEDANRIMRLPVGAKLYAAPQPAEQQPAPDVLGLVDALESALGSFDDWCEGQDPSDIADAIDTFPWVMQARTALSAHRKQGGDQS